MPTINDYYEYAKLANAAYVNLNAADLSGSAIATAADTAERLPAALANQTFNQQSPEANATGETVWSIPEGGYFGNDGTGFAATLFVRNGQKVLAIRGTEPNGAQAYYDLLKADIAQIGFIGFALNQTISMVNLILRLTASETKTDVGGDVFLNLHVRDAGNPGETPATGGVSVQGAELGAFATITLNYGAGGTVTLSANEFLSRFSADGLVIRGTASGDVLRGTAHADVIFGSGGSDFIDAGAGDDELDGGSGDDTIDGGAGNDTYLLALGGGRDSVFEDGNAAPTSSTCR